MYHCDFPGCDYETELRSQIVDHHIIPRSKGGSDKDSNLFRCCPSHHSHIFIPGMEHGIHSKYSEYSIVIDNMLLSTGGYVLEYHYVNTDETLYSSITSRQFITSKK